MLFRSFSAERSIAVHQVLCARGCLQMGRMCVILQLRRTGREGVREGFSVRWQSRKRQGVDCASFRVVLRRSGPARPNGRCSRGGFPTRTGRSRFSRQSARSGGSQMNRRLSRKVFPTLTAMAVFTRQLSTVQLLKFATFTS